MPRASIRLPLLLAFIAVTVLPWSFSTSSDGTLGDSQLFDDSCNYEIENETADADEEVHSLEGVNVQLVSTSLIRSWADDVCLDIDDQTRSTLESLNAPRPPPAC